MKIEKINTFNHLNQRKIKNNYIYHLEYKIDKVSFCANDKPKKTDFLNKLKKFLKGENIPQVACYIPREDSGNLSEDEIKSEQIKKFVGETIASYHSVSEKGKEAYSEIQEILKMGQKQNYQGTLKYNPDDNANVTFGKINSETNLPSAISIWRNGEFMYSYEILSINPIEYRLSIQDKDVDTVQEGIKDRVTSIIQQDKKYKLIKQFDTTECGFKYLFGRIKDDDFIEIKKRLYFDFKDIKGCMYGEGTPEGIPLYMYNQGEDLWEQVSLIEFEEE